ncbi:MAG: Mpv17/PMP22 family protein [Planctomycetota bacterium]
MNQQPVSQQTTGIKTRIACAFRTYFLPGLIIQIIGLSVVLSYYYIPAVKSLLEVVAGWKTTYGYWYSGASHALFAAFIPFIYMSFDPKTKGRMTFGYLIFSLLLWAQKGVEVDALYRLQGYVFGSAPSVRIVAIKLFFDQFVYAAFWGLPTVMALVMWRDNGYRFSALRDSYRSGEMKEKFVASLFSCWIVWIPTVSIIYCMPPMLQLPLCSIIGCFWILILTRLIRDDSPTPQPDELFQNESLTDGAQQPTL